ncbi:hypothetical protein HDU97_000049 [Phlyctochytrium planicorne]|nr:hypothetical protein HDU97_000049 [Phlyctochytrium planicorne]
MIILGTLLAFLVISLIVYIVLRWQSKRRKASATRSGLPATASAAAATVVAGNASSAEKGGEMAEVGAGGSGKMATLSGIVLGSVEARRSSSTDQIPLSSGGERGGGINPDPFLIADGDVSDTNVSSVISGAPYLANIATAAAPTSSSAFISDRAVTMDPVLPAKSLESAEKLVSLAAVGAASGAGAAISSETLQKSLRRVASVPFVKPPGVLHLQESPNAPIDSVSPFDDSSAVVETFKRESSPFEDTAAVDKASLPAPAMSRPDNNSFSSQHLPRPPSDVLVYTPPSKEAAPLPPTNPFLSPADAEMIASAFRRELQDPTHVDWSSAGSFMSNTTGSSLRHRSVEDTTTPSPSVSTRGTLKRYSESSAGSSARRVLEGEIGRSSRSGERSAKSGGSGSGSGDVGATDVASPKNAEKSNDRATASRSSVTESPGVSSLESLPEVGDDGAEGDVEDEGDDIVEPVERRKRDATKESNWYARASMVSSLLSTSTGYVDGELDAPVYTWLQEEKDVIKELRDVAKEQGHDQYEKSRAYIKEIKANEDSLSALHRKQKDLRAKLDNAQRKKNKDVESVRKELGDVDQETLAREAFHEGFKRERLKAALNVRWDGLMEYAAKLSVIANFGNHLANQIPQGYPTPGVDVPPFTGAATTAQILVDFEKCIANWTASVPWPFSPAVLPPLGQTPAIPAADTAAATRLSWSNRAADASGSAESHPLPSVPSPKDSLDVIPTSNESEYRETTPTTAESSPRREPYQTLPTPGVLDTHYNAVSTPDAAEQPQVTSPINLIQEETQNQPEEPYQAQPNFPETVPFAAQPVDAAFYAAQPLQVASANHVPSLAEPYVAAVVASSHSAPPSAPLEPQPYSAMPMNAKETFPMGYMTPAAPFEARPVNTYTSLVAPLDPSLAPLNVTAPNPPILTPTTPNLDVGNSSSKPQAGGGPVSSSDSSSTTKLKSEMRGETLTRQPPPPPSYEAAANAVRKAVGGLGVFVVCFEWVPKQTDELSLIVGDSVAASEVYEDGWAYGRVLRTGAIGFFPFNAVVPAIDGFGAAARSPPGQPTPESLRDEGSITLDAYQIIVDAISALRGSGVGSSSSFAAPAPPSTSSSS